MDYLIDGIIIVFVLSCIVFFYNALKIQHGSKNFPTPKDDSEKKENDKWTIIDKSKTSKAVLLVALNKKKGGVTMALIKCEECGIDLLVDGVEKFESKEVNARVDNCPNCGAGLMTKKEKIGLKSRNLEQVRRISVDKRPR